MTDWKDVAIGDYCALSTAIAKYEQSIQEDPRIAALLKEEDKILKEINEIAESRNHAIEEVRRKQDGITMQLKEKWDIEDKTFKCDSGTATIRTTKSLVITDKATLIKRLTSIFDGDMKKACSYIRSFNLSGIRVYMDANLIADHIAHYDENQSVIIKGVSDK